MAVRKPFIVGNWKLNKVVPEAIELAMAIKQVAGALHFLDIGIAPPFTALWPVANRTKESRVILCAQDCHHEDSGAYTGEVSAPLLRDVGVTHVIIGHSERRHVFGETDEVVNKKVHAVLRNDLDVILCIGETDAQREAGQTLEVVERQLEAGLKDVERGQAKKLTVAYEPVWAIGTGKTATPAQAEEVHEFIRKWLKEAYEDVGNHVRLLYGGSVNGKNAAELMAEAEIDGALVGGASLRAESFIDILKYRD